MNIEIYNNRCPMRCAHCPQAIQNPDAGSDRLPDLYAKITKLPGITPILVSMNNDVSDILPEIERFKLQGIHELVVGSTRMPIDPRQLMEIAKHPVVAGKNLHLVHLHKSIPYDKHLTEIILPLLEVLISSTVKTLQVAFNDNAMPHDRFIANKVGILTEDEILGTAFRSAWGFNNVATQQKFTSHAETESYTSAVSFNYEGRYFAFTRRIVSLKTETPTLEYYKGLARRDVDTGAIFSPNNLDLTITPLGVRISHQTWDIENPYLWLTHDELEVLMAGRSFAGLCDTLRAVVNKTLSMNIEGVFKGKLDTQSLSTIASMRKIA